MGHTEKYYEDDIDSIVETLQNDGVVAVNTDTVMGLCVISDSEKAFENLMKAKNRPASKLFPVMVSSVSMMKEIAYVSDQAEKVIDHFLPGQLTVILKKKEDSKILLDSETIAVRIVDDKTLIKIVEDLKKPIFLTSANKSGENPVKLVSEVIDIFDGIIDAVLMKDANGYEASTIVDLTNETLKIVRAGDISEEEIKKVMEE